MLYPANLSVQIKTYPEKHKLRKFMTTIKALQNILKEILYTVEKNDSVDYKTKGIEKPMDKWIHSQTL